MTIAPNRTAGYIKHYDDRGFGFVHGSDGAELFVHLSQWPQGAPKPKVGMRIAYVPGTNPRNNRPWAEQITIQARSE
jgi:cold shock CspA family protein